MSKPQQREAIEQLLRLGREFPDSRLYALKMLLAKSENTQPKHENEKNA